MRYLVYKTILVACVIFIATMFTAPIMLHAEGVVSPGFIFIDRADHLWTMNDPNLANLTDAPKTVSSNIPILMIEINIGRRGRKEPLGSRHSGILPALPYREIYVGAPPSEWGELGIGIKDFRPKRGLLMGYVYIVPYKELWENPYQTSSDRLSTSSSTYGVSGAWEEIKQTGVSLATDIHYVNVGNDVLHSIHSDLGRTGGTIMAETSYIFKPFRRLSIKPGVSATWTNLNGEANNYVSTQSMLNIKYASHKFIASLKVYSSSTDYAKTDPIFGLTREDSKVGGNLFIVLPGAFANNNLSLSMGAIIEESDSNITFFDTAQQMYYMALGFRL